MLEGIKEKATQPIGPLPAFAWVIVVVGGYIGYKFLKGRSGGGTTTAADTSTAVGATGSGVAPSSADFAALTSQIATLGNQVNTLTGQTSSGTTQTSSGSFSLTSVHAAINQTTGQKVSLPAGVSLPVVGSFTDTTGRLFYDVLYKGAIYNIGHDIGTYTATAGNTAAAAATTTETVVSTAVANAGVPAPTLTYGSNTAVTSPVTNPINVTAASGAIENQVAQTTHVVGSLPTMSSGAIKGSAVQIPTVTSAKKIVPKTITPPKPTQVIQASKQSIKAN
jgi:hypothetical protein